MYDNYNQTATGAMIERDAEIARFIEFGLRNPDVLDQLLKVKRMQSERDSRFDLNLAEGKYAEQIVDEILRGDRTIEVKLDERAADTGNLLIEYAKNGKPTGISTTEAQWYAFVLGGSMDKDVVVMMKTERLKALIGEYGNASNPQSGKGDKSNFILLPINKVFRSK